MTFVDAAHLNDIKENQVSWIHDKHNLGIHDNVKSPQFTKSLKFKTPIIRKMTQLYKQFQCVSSQLWKSNALLVQSTDVLVYILAVTVTALTN